MDRGGWKAGLADMLTAPARNLAQFNMFLLRLSFALTVIISQNPLG
jgi:hypothetical protein